MGVILPPQWGFQRKTWWHRWSAWPIHTRMYNNNTQTKTNILGTHRGEAGREKERENAIENERTWEIQESTFSSFPSRSTSQTRQRGVVVYRGSKPVTEGLIGLSFTGILDINETYQEAQNAFSALLPYPPWEWLPSWCSTRWGGLPLACGALHVTCIHLQMMNYTVLKM